MTTAIEEKQSTSEVSTIDRVLGDMRAVADAAETILWNLADDERPTAEERNVLRLTGILDRDDLARERGRVAAVKEKMACAGSKEEFAAANSAAVAAAKLEQERGPELEAQLEQIKAELGSLKGARLATAQVVNEMENARAALREQLLPRFVRDNYETECAAIRSNKVGRRINDLSNTIKLIDDLQEVNDPKVAQLHIEALELKESPSPLERAAIQAISRKVLGEDPHKNQIMQERIDMSAFRGYCKRRLQEERPLLERELSDLKYQQRSRIDALERLLGYYIDRL